VNELMKHMAEIQNW